MERTYFIRGREIRVNEISDVMAIKLKNPTKLNVIETRLGPLATNSPNRSERTLFVSDKEQEAFRKTGYIFVNQKEEASPDPDEIASTGRVFSDSKGHILVGSNRLIVKLKKEISDQQVQSILKDENLDILRQLKFAPNLYEVSVTENKDFLEVAFKLTHNDNFEYAEPVMIHQIENRFRPTDPDYNQQWQWNNSSDEGTPGAGIHAEAAWDITRGRGVRLALIDNGCDISHPDFKAAIATGAGYFRDDGSGDAHLVTQLTGFPDSNHGTFCAGIMVARANNGIGGCGVANLSDFIPVACLIDQVGTQTTLARSIAYAADPTIEIEGGNRTEGAHIISCSLGPQSDSEWQMESVLKDAIDFAVNEGRGGLGTPIFWAVSNGNFPIDQDQVCSYINTISVGRSNNRDMEDGSAFGAELDFLAPGANVYSTTSGGGYGIDMGTSFATPCAAGIAALLLAIDPKLTSDQVRKVMQDTCDKIGGVTYGANGHNDRYGFGRVNASRAVNAVGTDRKSVV